ncbi:MAG: Gfo/Idh/MocA family oxidoreductase [Bacillota bacterium]
MENKKFNWAVIGSGNIANSVCRQLFKSEKHAIATCYSRNKQTRDAFAEKFGAKSCATMAEALEDSTVDGIYIASPHGVHYEHVIEALDYNLPILCEKAFTLNAKETQLILAKAQEHNTFIAEAIWMFFNPTIKRAQEWIDSGVIGKVTKIEANFSMPFFKAFTSKRIWLNSAGAGALLDIGIYTLAFGYLFSGKSNPTSISGKMKIENTIDVRDDMNVVFGDIPCHLKCSMKWLSGRATITCEQGRIVLNRFHVPTSARLYKGCKRIEKHKAHGGYLHEFNSIVADIESGKKESHIVTQKDTLTLMHTMDEIRRQGGLKYETELK